MSDMIERVARKLTEVLRHHGVEMHPDDIRGLAHDAIAEMRTMSLAMMEAANKHVNTLMPNPAVFWQAVMTAALSDAP